MPKFNQAQMKKSILLTLLGISIGITGFTQDNPVFYGVRTHYGFIIPHSESLKEVSSTNPYGIQLELAKVRINEQSWSKCNCFTKTGIALNYYNYQNPEELGSAYSLTFFTEPYLTFKKRLFYSIRAGGGATYLTQVHDEETNPENTFYSSPLSFLVLLSGNVNYRITQHFTTSVSLYYNHISNGGMKQPNKGMNFPTVSLGLTYSPQQEILPEWEKKEDKKGVRQTYLSLFGTLPGTGSYNGLPEVRKLLIGFAGGVMYNVTQTNAFNAGIEVWSDAAEKEKQRRAGQIEGHRIVALIAGHNFTFGRLIFNQQLGIYIYKPYHTRDKYLYQRYELLYKIGNRFYIGSSLKVHRYVADNFDMRLRVTL